MQRMDVRAPKGLRAAFVAAAVLFALAAGSCRAPETEPVIEEISTYPTDGRPVSSLELIDEAMRSGGLEYSTGMLYKVYVMFEPESLPPEFASDVPAKCGTPLVAEVQRNWNLLSPDDRAEISRYIQPLGMPGETKTQLDDVTPDRLDHEREKLD